MDSDQKVETEKCKVVETENKCKVNSLTVLPNIHLLFISDFNFGAYMSLSCLVEQVQA